jgi:hypothetical protein
LAQRAQSQVHRRQTDRAICGAASAEAIVRDSRAFRGFQVNGPGGREYGRGHG